MIEVRCLSGPPGSGKTASGRGLAKRQRHGYHIDVSRRGNPFKALAEIWSAELAEHSSKRRKRNDDSGDDSGGDDSGDDSGDDPSYRKCKRRRISKPKTSLHKQCVDLFHALIRKDEERAQQKTIVVFDEVDKFIVNGRFRDQLSALVIPS